MIEDHCDFTYITVAASQCRAWPWPRRGRGGPRAVQRRGGFGPLKMDGGMEEASLEGFFFYNKAYDKFSHENGRFFLLLEGQF